MEFPGLGDIWAVPGSRGYVPAVLNGGLRAALVRMRGGVLLDGNDHTTAYSGFARRGLSAGRLHSDGCAIQPASMSFGLSAGTPPWSIAGLIGGAAVLSWVAVARTFPVETSRWRNQVSSFVVSGLVAWLLGGFVTRLLVLAWRTTGPGDRASVDALGTVVLTVLSCALARAATRWQRREFAWLVYGFMGLCAWKLATRDFPRGHSLSLVVSLMFYGGALIFLPRVLQKREHRGPTVKQEDLR